MSNDTREGETDGSASDPEQSGGSAADETGKVSKAKHAVVVIVLLAIIAAALGSVGRHVLKTYINPPPDTVGTGTGMMTMRMPESVGDVDAGIRLEVCLGPAFGELASDLATLAAAWPGQVRGEFHAFLSPDGHAFTEEHGQTLASIFINGSNEFTFAEDGGGKRTVRLHGPPGASYVIADVALALRQAFIDVYGEVPEDFEARARGLLETPDDTTVGCEE